MTPNKATNAAPTQQQAAPAAAPQAQPKRSWMGPLAGLAAGLGIAALMSHFGMGEAMGNFLMMALLALAAFFVIRLLMRRFGPKPAQGMQYAGPAAAAPAAPVQVSWPQSSGTTAAPVSPVAPATQTPTRAFVPAAFDSEGFERAAKMIFIRMQAANDSGDINDLRNFTTPEMFASVQLDVLERGAKAQHTEVLSVHTLSLIHI